MSERFYYAETTGYLREQTSGQRTQPGLTAMVLDRAYGHGAVYAVRSEQMYGGRTATRNSEATRRAVLVAERLNAGGSLAEAICEATPHGTCEHADRYGCECKRCREALRMRAAGFARRARPSPS